jgi:O-acetylserine/cysteine efflux transporter
VNGRDFALLTLICVAWGLNLPITKWVVESVPPLFYAALRFGGIALVLSPWLRPIPRPFGIVFAIAMLLGAVHFAFLFLGLANAPASSAAIVGQLGLPVTTVLSIWILGEKVRWRRMLGIALSFAGVMIIAFDPSALGVSVGLVYILISVLCGSAGSILMKKMAPIRAFTLQAWVALLSAPPLLGVSLLFETGHAEALAAFDWKLVAALAFSIFVVSIFGHAGYYQLLKRHDVTLLAPLTLMTPVVAVIVGVGLLGEPLETGLIVGGLVTLAGVGLVAMRPNASLPGPALSNTK